jgi:imidazole glycerol-phosphate synthase subunit HisH
VITIVDYGLGNIQAFLNVFNRLHIPARVAKTCDDLAGTSKLILPGVGAFDYAMQLLNDSGMRDKLDDLVLSQRIPVLGICVGMQILADNSEEGCSKGLGWIQGSVNGLNKLPQTAELPLPHMGWNEVCPLSNCKLFKDIENKARFYFLHSFYFNPQNLESSVATTFYGSDFTCAISMSNIYGVQFHPEKSHHYGELLLKNFSEIHNA